MAEAMGETNAPLRVAFDRRIKLEFRDARITSDRGLPACRKLDDALGLSVLAAPVLGEGRRGRNIRHHLLGLRRSTEPLAALRLTNGPSRSTVELMDERHLENLG
jgi:hypothetical protein